MRALVAAGLALFLVLTAGAPHVHAGPGPDASDDCLVCVARHGAAARSETPEVAPADVPVAAAPAEAGPPPVCGAPLGAIPGQSPPAAA